MIQITAKYDGRCSCGWHWDAGDVIYWEKGEAPICQGCGRAEEEHERKIRRQKEGKTNDR